MELDRFVLPREELFLKSVQILFAKPGLALEQGDSGEHKAIIPLGIAGLVKIEDVHRRSEVDWPPPKGRPTGW